jgi:hypothetical protein
MNIYEEGVIWGSEARGCVDKEEGEVVGKYRWTRGRMKFGSEYSVGQYGDTPDAKGVSDE